MSFPHVTVHAPLFCLDWMQKQRKLHFFIAKKEQKTMMMLLLLLLLLLATMDRWSR
jgi:hypothetical protein